MVVEKWYCHFRFVHHVVDADDWHDHDSVLTEHLGFPLAFQNGFCIHGDVF